MYGAASGILLVTRGFPALHRFPKPYLIGGTTLFVCYELCLTLSIGLARSPEQAIEVGMVNYLWPTFTIVAAVIVTKVRANLWLIPGTILSMCGIVLVMQDGASLGFDAIATRMSTDPLSYGLALAGALLWAAYSTWTAVQQEAIDGITFFFMMVAATLWTFHAFGGDTIVVSSPGAWFQLGLAATAMGLGYAAWNIGMLGGNVVVLAGASYFTPVLSAVFASLWLRAALPPVFWFGAALVTLGSVLCWWASRSPKT